MNSNDIIMTVDPGSVKCGIAVLDGKKQILHHEMVETKNISRRLILVREFSIKTIVIGNGTHSKEIKAVITEWVHSNVPLHGINIVTINERNTTELGKKLYFKHNPPKWFWRLIPISLQTPKVPYDDYAAVAIGIKYLEKSGK